MEYLTQRNHSMYHTLKEDVNTLNWTKPLTRGIWVFWKESYDTCGSFFFKPDGDTATDKNNALSDNAKVKQLRVSLDGTFYPWDRLEINWGKNDDAEAYKSYQKGCESNGNKEPILDMRAFKSLYTIYAIDLSAQKETITSHR